MITHSVSLTTSTLNFRIHYNVRSSDCKNKGSVLGSYSIAVMTLQPMTGWVVHNTVPVGHRGFCDGKGCTVEFETGDCWYHRMDGVDMCAQCGERHRAKGGKRRWCDDSEQMS